LAVDANQLRLDMRDIPEPAFAKLTDRATLQEMIPDLKQYGDQLQTRTTLQVIRPMEAEAVSQPGVEKDAQPWLEFQLNGNRATLEIKTDPGQSAWQPCAIFELNVADQVRSA